MDFKTELAKDQEIVNSELKKYLRKQDCKERILNEAMEYSLMAGGKRLRPILVLETFKLFNENLEKIIGNPAIITRKIDPTIVSLPITLEI